MISLRDFNITEQKIEGRTLSGYSVLYGVESREITERGRTFRERIAPGAFDESLSADVKLLYNHDASALLARTRSNTLTLRSDSKGLAFSASLPETTVGNDVRALLERGDLSGEMSFGFHVIADAWNSTRTERTVQRARLAEISIVQDAAYPQTSSALRSLQSHTLDAASSRIALHIARMKQWIK